MVKIFLIILVLLSFFFFILVAIFFCISNVTESDQLIFVFRIHSSLLPYFIPPKTFFSPHFSISETRMHLSVGGESLFNWQHLKIFLVVEKLMVSQIL